MNHRISTLAALGWRPLLQQQLTFEDLATGYAARVSAVHRDRIELCSLLGAATLPITGLLKSDEPELRPTTGDWLWLDNESHLPLKLLARMNHLQRTAAGSEPKTQLLAANIDTLFIVSSCNEDFNLSRIERYLSLVMAAHIPAVIVLTKADLCATTYDYVAQAQRIHDNVPVLAVNALADSLEQRFQAWTGVGQTIAFIGSSGVGKSTLSNSLLGQPLQDTGAIRSDDAKGRHTTTERSLHPLPGGGWVLDTPGMRELRLNDDQAGVAELFADIELLQQECRFTNCHHADDQGCAIQAALARGVLAPRRWHSYLKLQREAKWASTTKQQKRSQVRQFTKKIRQHQKAKQGHHPLNN
ncbi:ribosome small subunit-dependent GTPase A [Reinekea sp.]|uniref:ribosome small subunit-dependent GTPase A n=1 Tax=Reinekea sp. TaxID=1970455 RepID=UPI002A8200BD|nr:ribosome small subunit-dependent GTPase A [Reinekea sp.]